MTANPHVVHLPPPERLGPARFALSVLFGGVAVIGAILSCIGAAVDHVQFAYSWFFSFYFFFSIVLGAFFWVTLHYACDSDWSVIARRTWENMIGVVPVMFVLFIPFLWPNFIN